jgi:tetraacyldisaccharide 4'-kinase
MGRGIAFDVLSRGYGRTSRAAELVDSAGTPARFGDEPLLIARSLEVPVIVGASRYAAGRLAEKLFAEARPAHGQWVHLLDDGFQHRSLARDFDVVLVTASDLTDKLLPFGRLREPLSALARAHAIVIDADLDDLPLQSFGKPIWRMRRKVSVPDGPPAVVFCGIARPERFFQDVLKSGALIKTSVAFTDHHRYTSADIKKLLTLRNSSGAERFITTEKDLVRLSPWLAQLQPIAAARLELDIENAPSVVDQILSSVSSSAVRP